MNLKSILKKIKNSEQFNKVISYAGENKTKLKVLALVIICGIMIIKGIMQQPEILKNKEEISQLKEEIKYEEKRQEEVETMRENVETDEYIERIARDKLGMMKQNEKVFIDASASE